MLLHQQTEEAAGNVAGDMRLDRETAEKVTALALRLQERRGSTLSVHQIEEAGKEVGLEPEFVHEALAQVRQSQQKVTDKTTGWLRWGKVIHPAWWASGWALPVMLAAGAEGLHIPDGMVGAAFMGAMGIYVGFGVILSMLFGDQASKPLTAEEQEALLRSIGNWTHPPAGRHNSSPGSPSIVATSASLTAPAGGVHLYVMSRSSAGSATDFAVWVLSIMGQEGGELLAAVADGIECRFATPEAAIRAAHRLQDEEQSVACGVSPAGPMSRDMAMTAVSGDIVIDESFAGEGLRELGRLARLDGGPRGALSWKAGSDG